MVASNGHDHGGDRPSAREAAQALRERLEAERIAEGNGHKPTRGSWLKRCDQQRRRRRSPSWSSSWR
jgi:hypothetical protein